MTSHLLDLTRTIRDPIHGAILLTTEEIEVVNHPLFRRLHHVKQNGLLYLVFPSAKHTRFEHSLGTLKLADTVLGALLRNAVVARHKPTSAVFNPTTAPHGTAVDFSRVDEGILRELFRISRLASLCHDLGHGPFSHHFDVFAPRRDDLVAVFQGDVRYEALRALLADESPTDLQLWTSSAPTRVKHEIMSCFLFAEIWSDNGGDPAVAQKVMAVILGRSDWCNDERLKPFILLLHDIVASAPADADRMDYLERDSRALGVSYGLYDRNRLLKSFLAYRSSKEPIEYRLGIKLSGARAVENFVQARFELFVQIYYHKTNRAVQLMLDNIARRIDEAAVSIFDWSSLSSIRDTYRELTDERFISILRGRDPVWQLGDTSVTSMAESIWQRQLWKRVFEGPFDACRVIQEKINDGYDEGLFVLDRVEPKATKDLDGGAKLLRRTGDGAYTLHPSTWLEQSPIIAALAAEEKAITRLFIRSSDEGLANDIRQRIWNLQL